MPTNERYLRTALQQFNFRDALIELGWDHHNAAPPAITLGTDTYHLDPIAQKRGVQIFFVRPGADGQIPPRAIRQKLDRKVTEYAREHLLIYADAARTRQVWQWVDRQPGKPTAFREHAWHVTQDLEILLQKLRTIAFDINEEEAITLSDVTFRLKDALDKEQVTKRFYREFDAQRKAFLKKIQGVGDAKDREWYCSALLNRLMFVYFLQRKGFLDGNTNYLRDRLQLCQERFGEDEFYSFYRTFLIRLFHDGLGKPRDPKDTALRALLGDVPYLNGGLFQLHEVESQYEIDVPDEAFEALFHFFDQWDWTLDYRPLQSGREINPDVLGYIFEQYINQKQMGAYYTKEDITGYITRNTLLPFVLDEARRRYPAAFEGKNSVWQHLQQDPDAYIYPSVQHTARDENGNPRPLPDEIATGLADVAKRDAWNTPTPPAWGLPTEIWRETVARRQRYEEVRRKLVAGEVQSTSDLVTLNLDIEQFTLDVIERCETPDLLRALWKALRGVSVLDPTCGSGAFLFAALERLERLYTACLERMQAFIGDLDTDPNASPQVLSDFRAEIKEAYDTRYHPNLRYFVLKRILLDNLYGVDIMPEAVEICKLRLFLKLAAQVDAGGRLEALPDIDFNVRSGNALVGYATREEVHRALTAERVVGGADQGELLFENRADALAAFEERLDDVRQLALRFREQQTVHGGEVTPEDKRALRQRMSALAEVLDHALAVAYGLNPDDAEDLATWRESHQPFHWFAEFYGVMTEGGFDVVIGNPPYLEERDVNYTLRGYQTGESGAIHAMCVERGLILSQRNGTLSMILPMSVVSTQRMAIMQKQVERGQHAWYANYSWRPAKLFDQVNRALTILVTLPAEEPQTFSTTYQKWTSDTREGLLERLSYEPVPHDRNVCWVPKISDAVEVEILNKMMAVSTVLAHLKGKRTSRHRMYYRTTGGLYWKVFTDFAPAFNVNGIPGHSTRETNYPFREAKWVRPVIAALSSDLFWWWYTVSSNCRDLNPYDLDNFPLPLSILEDPKLLQLSKEYLDDIVDKSTMLVRNQKRTGRTETQSFKIQKSKFIINEIDRVLARHYDLTDEELDFIINYDIKYRLGADAFVEDEEEVED